MNKLSQLLLSLLRLSMSRTSDIMPNENEGKEAFIQRFNTSLISVVKYPDIKTRTQIAINSWYIYKFIETKNKIQQERENIKASL